MVALNIQAVAEALALAEAAGADPALVREALQGGFADSRILHEHGARRVGGRGRRREAALPLAADLLQRP